MTDLPVSPKHTDGGIPFLLRWMGDFGRAFYGQHSSLSFLSLEFPMESWVMKELEIILINH